MRKLWFQTSYCLSDALDFGFLQIIFQKERSTYNPRIFLFQQICITMWRYIDAFVCLHRADQLQGKPSELPIESSLFYKLLPAKNRFLLMMRLFNDDRTPRSAWDKQCNTSELLEFNNLNPSNLKRSTNFYFFSFFNRPRNCRPATSVPLGPLFMLDRRR